MGSAMAKKKDEPAKQTPKLEVVKPVVRVTAEELAKKQREIFEEAVKDVTAMVQTYKPGGSPQEIMAKQAEFAKKAMEAAIANTRDIAELVQKSSAEAFRIVQDRMKESYEEIRNNVEKKL